MMRLRLAALTACAAFWACTAADLYPISGSSGAGGSDAGAGGAAGAVASAGSPACTPNQSVLAGQDETHTVVVDGKTRSFILHVPPAYDPSTPTPLVLDFHGLGESAASELSSSPYVSYLDARGVVMAFPSGLNGPAGSAWNVGPCCVANVDDVAFARAVVTQIQSLACIDAKRVYAVGVLTGGGMAHYVACHAADVFAAVAPAAFDLLQENEADCKPSRPVSVITFRGTADARVPFNGGATSVVPNMPATFLGAQASFERWAEIDNCVGSASAPDANGCMTYSQCGASTEVVLCVKQGGREEAGDPAIAWPILSRHSL